jgi:VIT1/CCC1 family predicted Fe2+/Mn2+ transporter
VLEPIERISEVLFGLIMVLTFTGSLSVAESGRDDVKAMLIGALGCNLAWGIIDAILYLMGAIAERGQKLSLFRAVRTADPDDARRLISRALPPVVASVMTPAEIDVVRERLSLVTEPAAAGHLRRDDYLGAIGVFLLVFLSTLPVAVPFMLIGNAHTAMRASNTVAVVLLLLTGWAFGRLSGRHPLLFALGMVLLGLTLVAMTIALGG